MGNKLHQFFYSAALSLFLLIGPHEANAQENLDEKGALHVLQQRINVARIYESWRKWECFNTSTEYTTSSYFDFVIHENHAKIGCSGDPAVESVTVDRFRVYRSNKKILWYDFDGDYVPFKRVIEFRKQK